MLNLISKTPHKCIEQIGEDAYYQYCGMLTTPQSGFDVTKAKRWALDNGCYLPGYDGFAIARHLKKWQGVTGCIFAVVPDYVGDHNRTMHLFRSWIGVYHKLGYPPAFACQDGATVRNVPFNHIACVFIGGSTPFKYSQDVVEIVREAQKRGLWVHMGRVGGKSRFRYCRDVLNVDSFDSTGFSIHPPKIKKWLPDMQVKQYTLWEII